MAVKAPRVVRKIKHEGKWIFAAVAVREGRLDFSRVVVKGKTVAAIEGTFHLDFRENGRRRRPAVGDDPASVKRALQTQAHVLELRKRGVEADDAPELRGPGRVEGESLAAIAAEFRSSPPARLARKSAAKYRNALETFAGWAAKHGITHAVQADAKAMERWMCALRDVDGLDASTIVDKVIIVSVELRKRGAVIQLRPNDLPKVTEREREIYKPEMLKAIFAACRPHEFALYQTFLLTGMREQEVAFLGWDDVDAERATLRVRRKPDLGFTPKNYQERVIPVPRRLIALLGEHRERTGAAAGLVFATSACWAARGVKGGQRDKKMLLKLKQLAKRAGLNCGHCVGTAGNKPVTCATHAICGKFGLHRFRHTYATNHLRDRLDIVSLQKLLGHKDLDSTRRYLRALEPDEMQSAIERSTLSTMFGSIQQNPIDT